MRTVTAPEPAAGVASTHVEPLENASAHWLRFVHDMQRVQTQALQRMRGDARTLSIEARASARPQDLLSLQIAYVTEEWARASQLFTQTCGLLLDAQSAFVKDAEVALHSMLASAVDDGAHTPTMGATLAAPADAALPWMQLARSTWTEGTKVWLDALAHDVQEVPAGEAQRPRRNARKRS